MRVLLIEDNVELADLTALNLRQNGFVVEQAYDGEGTRRLLEEQESYDVVILDLNLPDIEGLELLSEIKTLAPRTPVIALTARDTEAEKVQGLKKGLDDYLVKPFSHQELMARLRVLYRSNEKEEGEEIRVKNLKVSPQKQVVKKGREQISLTLSEFRIFHYLLKKANRLVSPQELLESVWDWNGDGNKAKLFTTISRLRKKIGDKEHKIIKTSDGGYMINA